MVIHVTCLLSGYGRVLFVPQCCLSVHTAKWQGMYVFIERCKLEQRCSVMVIALCNTLTAYGQLVPSWCHLWSFLMLLHASLCRSPLSSSLCVRADFGSSVSFLAGSTSALLTLVELSGGHLLRWSFFSSSRLMAGPTSTYHPRVSDHYPGTPLHFLKKHIMLTSPKSCSSSCTIGRHGKTKVFLTYTLSRYGANST